MFLQLIPVWVFPLPAADLPETGPCAASARLCRAQGRLGARGVGLVPLGGRRCGQPRGEGKPGAPCSCDAWLPRGHPSPAPFWGQHAGLEAASRAAPLRCRGLRQPVPVNVTGLTGRVPSNASEQGQGSCFCNESRHPRPSGRQAGEAALQKGKEGCGFFFKSAFEAFGGRG